MSSQLLAHIPRKPKFSENYENLSEIIDNFQKLLFFFCDKQRYFLEMIVICWVFLWYFLILLRRGYEQEPSRSFLRTTKDCAFSWRAADG